MLDTFLDKRVKKKIRKTKVVWHPITTSAEHTGSSNKATFYQSQTRPLCSVFVPVFRHIKSVLICATGSVSSAHSLSLGQLFILLLKAPLLPCNWQVSHSNNGFYNTSTLSSLHQHILLIPTACLAARVSPLSQQEKVGTGLPIVLTGQALWKGN